MKYKTTKRHFEEFQREAVKWAEAFGLHRVELYVFHENDGDNLAWANFNANGQSATIGLGKVWNDYRPTIDRVRRSAFHEVMEIFLFQARRIAQHRYVTSDEIDEEWHRIIRTLETVVFDSGKITAQ
jgi:hypothetical protein